MRARFLVPWIALISACLATATPPPAPQPLGEERAVVTTSPTPHDAEPLQPPAPPEAPRLAYVEHILGDGDAMEALPLIVAIHGLGDTPESFADLFAGFPEPARLVLFRGLDPTPNGGWSWFPIRARTPDVERLSEGIAAAADQLAVAIEGVARERPTQGKPIVTGFSQGGMLSFTLAVHHPEIVGMAIPIGGWLPPPLWPHERAADGSNRPPIFALHGKADEIVRFEPTQQSVQHLEDLGLDASLQGYEGVAHTVTSAIRRDLFAHLIEGIRQARQTTPANP